jgi:peptidoglycan hydrolase-like protein with peptidoglycan-binding domain
MRSKKTTHLALTLLIAAGLGVSADFASAQSSAQKKPSYTKPGTKSHRGKTSKTSSKSSRREKGQKAPTPERITEIQQALAKNGAYSATPNGKWDDSTVEAMRNFQETHGLNPTGKLDAKTLQQLGLGGQTSGVAPPMLPSGSSSTSSRLTASPTQSVRRQQ